MRKMTPTPAATGMLLAACLTACALPAAWADTVKFAFIDPFSGPFGNLGQSGLHTFRSAEELYQRGKDKDSNTLEFTEFDNKLSSQESLSQLKAAADQGYRYLVQGVGSGATAALIDALNKYNERNPGKEILLIDWTAADPDLTNSKCGFWHYRFDANGDMKIEAMTTYIAKDASVKKVYLVNQNIPSGQQAARAAKEYLKRKRPDIQIVGDDMIPAGQVKDFAPYVAKIKASDADTIVSANTGNDMALLIKAVKDANLKTNIYTLYAQASGSPTAMGSAGVDRVRVVSSVHANVEGDAAKDMLDSMQQKYKEDYVSLPPTLAVGMLHQAFRQTHSTDPVKVAFALEGMKWKGETGEVEMRKTDHQIQLPLYLSVWSKANASDVRHDQEGTGYGWKTMQKFDSYVATQPTSCVMKRPAAR